MVGPNKLWNKYVAPVNMHVGGLLTLFDPGDKEATEVRHYDLKRATNFSALCMQDRRAIVIVKHIHT